MSSPGGSVKTDDGLAFEVKKAAVVGQDDSRLFLVEFSFTNGSTSRKIDLADGFEFQLKDPSGNQYRKLPPPSDWKDPLEIKPSGYPSIYPSESLAQTIFFELPVAGVASLLLTVKAAALGSSAFQIDLPLTGGAVKPRLDPGDGLLIASPDDGSVVVAGDDFQLQVNIPGKLPAKLIIIALNHSFEDLAPAAENSYDITVPLAFLSPQAGVSVIGVWNDAGADKIITRDIALYIRQPAFAGDR